MPDKKQFPISYISHCRSPKAMFASRGEFSWWQNLLIIVFLNALMMIPVTLHYARMPTYPLERIVAKSLAPITDKTYHALTQGKIEKNTFQGPSLICRDGELVLAVLPTKRDLEKLTAESTRQIIVTHNEWRFIEPKGKELRAQVRGKDQSLVTLTTAKAVRAFVNQQWYDSNKASVLAFLLLSFALMVYVGTVIVIGLGAFFLTLTKQSRLFMIRSFSEGLGLMVNCLAWPSLLAILLSFFIQDPILVMNCQVFGTLLMLTVVFYKTHFREDLKA
ncbi:DUF1189 domain-containing protein [Streptococcus halichoeri]|uniref:DUF1189 domain-containing protein n=1 Tax=Streptococcus halichoeri TaxID=254785 RepID=UPI00135CDEB3|nr:maltodextrose utilization protein malA [Streptococcus halichoeri]